MDRSSSPRIAVAAALIRRRDGAVLLAQRHRDAHQGGLWEFPGGKIESGERAIDALARELDEELGIQISRGLPLIRIDHRYPDKSVRLHVLEVNHWRGEAYGREAQRIQWVQPEQFAQLDFPAANLPITTAAQLPPLLWRLAPQPFEVSHLVRQIDAAVELGIVLMHLDCADGCDTETMHRLLEHAAEAGVSLMLSGRVHPSDQRLARGLHLSTAEAEQRPARDLPHSQYLSLECRGDVDLRHVARLSADFIRVSLHQAGSWAGVRRLLRAAQVPVFIEGCEHPAQLALARRIGAQGMLGCGQLDDAAQFFQACNGALKRANVVVR